MHDDAMFKQIYERMNLRETGELLAIWAKNDRVEWSAPTFEVIKEILQGRSVALPPQNEPVYVYQPQKKASGKLKEFFGIVADTDSFSAGGRVPLFYKPQKVYVLQKWINLTVILAIVAKAAETIRSFSAFKSAVSYYLASSADSIVVPIAYAVTIFSIVLQIAFIVAALKGLSYILKILMQFEYNSRAAGIKNTRTGND
jgi:hypothetical protein